MNNLFVYCEIENGEVAEVSLELLTKGRKLANQLHCQLEAVAIGSNIKGIESKLFPYGVDQVHIAEDKRLYPYTTLPHSSILVKLIEEEKPQDSINGCYLYRARSRTTNIISIA